MATFQMGMPGMASGTFPPAAPGSTMQGMGQVDPQMAAMQQQQQDSRLLL